MKDKIGHKYGAQARNCIEGLGKGDLDKIAKCIDDISNLSYAAIFKDLTRWSVECAFAFNEEMIKYLQQDNEEKQALLAAEDSAP